MRTQFVSVSSELPVSADRAYALAQKLETFEFVVSPVLRLALSDEQRAEALGENAFRVGAEYSGRLWYFKIIPAWKHKLRIISGGPLEDGGFEIYTNETSGPVRVWNHRLTFKPTGEASCRYTDQIEIPAGVLDLATRIFVNGFFRYRQRRWRKLVA
ncbi:MAG: hypothetical protein JHC98_10010 [Thermoleophilaceae bacterium]|nr:hypothetical protein [Thermoleophilaceae bacterium]